jgi:oxygen-independent coproporphyrinogen-3 oxidase
MINSAYIHIPFCQQICHYCDFTKFFYNEKLATDYIEALTNEINVNVPGQYNKVKTIYIGGGTPTALNIDQLYSLMTVINRKFDVTNCEEFTIEANPGDFDKEKAKLLKDFGVNRISLGVQVFDNQMLKELGRLHKVSDVYQTIDQLHQQNLSNISLDLIYALPNQTVEQFQTSLDEAVSFQLPHYSTYALQIEPKTVFYQRHKKGKLSRPPEEEEVEMYQILNDTMMNNGILQYEISNFAKPGFESKHNLTYWSNEYYYGLGAGASGYLPGKRFINLRPLPAYTKQAMANGKPVLHVDEIGLKEQIEEEMFLGLRKMEGINKAKFENRYGFPIHALYNRSIIGLVQEGLLTESEQIIQLTDKGKLLANDVFEKFLLEDSDLVQVD